MSLSASDEGQQQEGGWTARQAQEAEEEDAKGSEEEGESAT